MDAYGIGGAVPVNSRGYRQEANDDREYRYVKIREYGRPASYDDPRANALLDYLKARKFQTVKTQKIRRDLGFTKAQFNNALETATLMDAALGEDKYELIYWPWKELDENENPKI